MREKFIEFLFKRCQKCEAGQYSLKTTDTQCYPCIENAVCYGGNQIFIKPGLFKAKIMILIILIFEGFWRKSPLSISSYDCLNNYDNCLCLIILFDILYYFLIFISRGGFYSDCSPGYYGPLCSVCVYDGSVENYKFTDSSCIQCPSMIVNLIIILLLLVLITAFLIVIIR